LIEIGIGEHLARPLTAAANDDVAKVAGCDVGTQRLDGDTESGGGFVRRAQSGGRRDARLALAAGLFSPCPVDGERVGEDLAHTRGRREGILSPEGEHSFGKDGVVIF
jgi:hypothetical protein